MSDSTTTIKEAKVEKGILQAQIGKLISEFETTFGLTVDDVTIKQRFTNLGDMNDVCTIEVEVKL